MGIPALKPLPLSTGVLGRILVENSDPVRFSGRKIS